MNIPPAVLAEAAVAMADAVRRHPNSTWDALAYDAAPVIAEWARREALRPVIGYLNHCRILRTEPTTAGLTNALADAITEEGDRS